MKQHSLLPLRAARGPVSDLTRLTMNWAFRSAAPSILKNTIRPLMAAVCTVGALTLSAQAESTYTSWIQRFDPTSDAGQVAAATAMDARGNVVVVGDITVNGHREYYTAKYAANSGQLLWSKTYWGGQVDSKALDVAVDSEGNVIVTGGSTAGNLEDFYTVKYRGTDGAQIWERRYNNPAQGGADRGLKVVVDLDDNVIVTGSSLQSGNEDFYTAKYNKNTGAIIWERRYNAGAAALQTKDLPTDLAVDQAGNVIVTGVADEKNGAKIYTVKYFKNSITQTAQIDWERTYTSPNNEDSETGGLAVAVDPAGNVLVTGVSRSATSRDFYTAKYDAMTGGTVWDELFTPPEDDENALPVDIASDSAGNAIVTGASVNGAAVIQTIKYPAAGGAPLWSNEFASSGGDAKPSRLVVDGSDNVIVAGYATTPDGGGFSPERDFYTVKYSAATGATLWENRFNDTFDNVDEVRGLAVDLAGNVAVSGTGRKDINGTGRDEIVTIKYNRLIAETGTKVTGGKIKSLSSPAIADGGQVAAKISFKKKNGDVLGAILLDGPGGQSLPAVQKQDAPGVTGAKFATFFEPLIAPNGDIAFFATLTGVNEKAAAGVWTTAFDGTLSRALQYKQPVPGLPDTVLKAVASISLRNGNLVSLLKVSGATVTASNNTVLLSQTPGGGAQVLLRTGQLLVPADPNTAITGITVLLPATGSPGSGRWQGDTGVVARVNLLNGGTELVHVLNSGQLTRLLASGANASSVVAGSTWKSFGLPGVGSDGSPFVSLGFVELPDAEVDPALDSALVTLSGNNLTGLLAKEGQAAPKPVTETDTPTYKSFLHPLVNAEGLMAFVANLDGAGVTKANNSALYFGIVGNLQRVARLGQKAPNADGLPDKPVLTTFVSTALPSGPGAGPVFIAQLAGKDVTEKNDQAIYALDSEGVLRELLREGDKLGKRKVARFTLLEAVRGGFGVSRSFNENGSVVARVTFTDGTQALAPLSTP